MGSEQKTEPDNTGEDEPQPNKDGILTRLKNPQYRRKYLRTIWIGAAFCGLGFSMGQRGPAFLDIQIITHTDVEAASFFFTAASIGYLLGSVVAGVIYDKLNKSILLLGCVLGLAAATIATPFCSIYGLMITAFFGASLFGGALDTAGNAEMLRIWGKDGEMAMQFVHFAFAVGGVISPLFTEPFLTPNPEDEGEHSQSTTNPPTTENATVVWENSTDLSNMTGNSTNTLPLTTDVHYAYIICGTAIFLTAIPLTVDWFMQRSDKRRQEQKDVKDVKQPLPRALFFFVLAILYMFYFLYCCVEDSFAAYLTTFVVKQLHWSKSDGAKVTSAFWASFAIGRFLSIFAIRLLSTVKLLALCSIMLMTSMLCFLLASQFCVTFAVWICSVASGLAMSAIFPSGFTWMEDELLRVTGRVASCILIAASSGTMTNPILLGYLMDEVTPMWFAYLLFAESVATFLVFAFLLALSRLYLKNHYVMHDTSPNTEVVVPTLEMEVSAPEHDGHAVGNSAI